MNPTAIVNLYSQNRGNDEGAAYLETEGLFGSLDSIAKNDPTRITPSWSDLARLHAVVRARKVFTILEFGVGFSTIVLADALKKNEQTWDAAKTKPKIRSSNPFE